MPEYLKEVVNGIANFTVDLVELENTMEIFDTVNRET